jgi:subtilisin family serine protease
LSRKRPAYASAFAPEAIRVVSRNPVLDAVRPDDAWGGSSGKGVKVAVIDSGIDADHPVIGGRISGYVAINETAEGTTFDTSPHRDDFGHGTACAGIVRSFVPDCDLYSVKVLGAGLRGKGSVFLAGLRWAIENEMDVCNLSLGSTKRDFYAALHELADLAYYRGTILVTAANNMPVPSYPSVFASVISVAAHDVPEPYTFYYNPEPPVEFGAYGIDVRVGWMDGGYLTTTGNSFAAPHITGLVTKILGKHPGLTAFQIKSMLRALATNTGEQGATENSSEQSGQQSVSDSLGGS